MKNSNKIRAWGFSILIGSIMSIVPTSAFAESVLYGIDNLSGTLGIVNPVTGIDESFTAIFLAGETISKYPPAKPGALICEPLEAACTEPQRLLAPPKGVQIYTSCI